MKSNVLASLTLTIYDALTTACRLIENHTTGLVLWLADDGHDIWFCNSEPPNNVDELKYIEQFSLLKLIQVIQLGLGSYWEPKKIRLNASNAKHIEDYELFGNAKLMLECPYTAVAISRSELCAPIHSRPRVTISGTEQLLQDDKPPESLVGVLRSIVGGHLKEDAIGFETVAEIVGVCTRTLKRMLANEGLTYRKLMDQVRCSAANHYLSDPDIPICAISYDLGYSNVTHFYRAFRRRSCVTPADYRNSTVGSLFGVEECVTKAPATATDSPQTSGQPLPAAPETLFRNGP